MPNQMFQHLSRAVDGAPQGIEHRRNRRIHIDCVGDLERSEFGVLHEGRQQVPQMRSDLHSLDSHPATLLDDALLEPAPGGFGRLPIGQVSEQQHETQYAVGRRQNRISPQEQRLPDLPGPDLSVSSLHQVRRLSGIFAQPPGHWHRIVEESAQDHRAFRAAHTPGMHSRSNPLVVSSMRPVASATTTGWTDGRIRRRTTSS